MTKHQSLFTTAFPDLPAELDKPLAPLTYFKIGGPAELFVQTDQLTHLKKIRHFCLTHEIPLTIMGGCSNIIVADEGIAGVVLRLTHQQMAVEKMKGSDLTILRVGAGAKTALLVSFAVQHHLAGLEYFLGVPGTVGGAVFNNAHYLNHLMSEYIHRVQVINAQGDNTWLLKSDCQFEYDYSRFHNSDELIYEVEFALPVGNQEQSMQLIKEATEYRAKTQPLGEPSSGCIFQNTPNTPELQQRFPQFKDKPYVPGGFLIDQAGLKGAQIGDIQVSHKHAAFFVNKGKGTAQDVKTLIAKVKETVKNTFGVDLREEVFYLGQQAYDKHTK